MMLTPNFSTDFTTAVLNPRITFTRALATATRTNSSGYIETVNADTPRFDYDPITKICRGLLIEETRQNLIVQSENFGSWSILTNATIGTNVINSPANTLTADKLEETSATGVHRVGQTVALGGTVDSSPYAISVYAKAAERTKFVLFDNSQTVSGDTRFDLSTGTIISGQGRIQPVGDGWYRCTAFPSKSTSTNSTPIILLLSPSNQTSYAGTTGSGIYIWGAQVEIGAYATSYIPTTTTALTRNADVATITGTNFSDFWQASKGGVLVRARPSTVSGIRPWLQFDDGTANEIIALRGNTTNPELYIVDGGTPQAQIDAGTIAANTNYSLTGWWATNDCKAKLDSGAVVTDTSATIPTVTQARLGSDGTNYLNGHLASISYYDSFSEQIYTRRKNKAVFNLM